jgi:hypothetical protein
MPAGGSRSHRDICRLGAPALPGHRADPDTDTAAELAAAAHKVARLLVVVSHDSHSGSVGHARRITPPGAPRAGSFAEARGRAGVHGSFPAPGG